MKASPEVWQVSKEASLLGLETPRVRKLGTGLAAAVLGLTGCSALSHDRELLEGPLIGLRAYGKTCFPVRKATSLSFGLNEVFVERGKAVLISDVSLYGAEGVKLVGVALLPMQSNTTFGVTRNYPPRKLAKRIVGTPWSAAIPADGSTAIESPPSYNLVLHLEKEQGVARFASFGIKYEVDGEQFETKSHIRDNYGRRRFLFVAY